MSTNDSQALPPNNDSGISSGDDSQITTGSNREVHWEIVARTPGITVAEIIAGRLQAEGIPAQTWQEGAGEALGLMVGKLGTGHVVVPKEYAKQARAILAEDVDEDVTNHGSEGELDKDS